MKLIQKYPHSKDGSKSRVLFLFKQRPFCQNFFIEPSLTQILQANYNHAEPGSIQE